MMPKILFVVLLVILASCQHVERPARPDDLIAKDTMVQIMTDVYLGNAARSVNNKVLRQNAVELDSMIYRKYGIDSMQFVRSNTYYTSRLDDYAEIFTGVEARLSQLQRQIDSINIPQGTEGRSSSKVDTTNIEPQLIDPAGDN